jgi:hypothetical protein
MLLLLCRLPHADFLMPVRSKAALWSAPAERSGDGALDSPAYLMRSKAVSRCACPRTPKVECSLIGHFLTGDYKRWQRVMM